jgi:hypothetical protein
MADALEEVQEVSSPMLVFARLRDMDVELLSSDVVDERFSLSVEGLLPVSRPLDSLESDSAVESPDARVTELCVLARADRELVRSETLFRVSVSDSTSLRLVPDDRTKEAVVLAVVPPTIVSIAQIQH